MRGGILVVLLQANQLKILTLTLALCPECPVNFLAGMLFSSLFDHSTKQSWWLKILFQTIPPNHYLEINCKLKYVKAVITELITILINYY